VTDPPGCDQQSPVFRVDLEDKDGDVGALHIGTPAPPPTTTTPSGPTTTPTSTSSPSPTPVPGSPTPAAPRTFRVYGMQVSRDN
jgi:hypothetical protein